MKRFDENKPVPPHLSWVETDVYKGVSAVGRCWHYPEGQVVVRGHGKDEKGEWFEFEVQLNHCIINHQWKIVQDK
jgi:hypothetical protein